jgi:hypothetical protein
VIDEMKISQAFAFDHHFHQLGTVQVAPDDQAKQIGLRIAKIASLIPG